MSILKLSAAAAILPSIILTVPALAQEAVQEPGAQAFYESLGVGSAARTNARASMDDAGTITTLPAKHHKLAPRAAHKR